MAEGERVIVGYEKVRRRNLRVVVPVYGVRVVCEKCKDEFWVKEKDYEKTRKVCGRCRWKVGAGADD